MREFLKKNKRILLIIGIAIAGVLLLGGIVYGSFRIYYSVNGCSSHIDRNDDGKCDKCRKSVVYEVDFFAINDIHGKFSDSSTQPGVDELTNYLKEQKMVCDNIVLLSSGDMWQGSSESNLTHGQIMIDWMNQMDFVSMTLGNHEFDWGEAGIAENAEFAEFPFLAINVYDRETKQPVEYCTPSVLVNRGEITIGIIGAVGDCYSSIATDQSKGFYLITGNELSELVKKESEFLKAQGADFIVLSIHDGYDESVGRETVIIDRRLAEYYDIALSAEYIDLVFEAHTHQTYVLKDSKGIYHLQGGGENKGISHVTATVNIANGENKVICAEVVSSSEYARKAKDSLRNELLDKYSEQISFAIETLGTNSVVRDGDELREIVSKLYYETGVEKWGNEYKIVLGGGFLQTRNPWNLSSGDVNYAMLQSLFPFDNELVLCSVSGADLNRVFFNTTNGSYGVYYDEYGESIKGNVNPVETYYVIVDSYTSTYAPNHLTEIERYGSGVYARDLLSQYVAEGNLE